MNVPKRGKCVVLGVAAVLCVFASGRAPAADDAAVCRSIAAKWADAVVTVQLVVKMGMSLGGESSKQEIKPEVTGAVVDSSGLTVVSLFMVNPIEALQAMMPGEAGSITSEVTDAKIRLSDGREIPGKIVLRDKDLDLAFIRPTQKLSSPIPALALKDCSKVDTLDQVVVLDRLGKVANRALSVYVGRIQAVVDKPRRFYFMGLPDTITGLGAPVIAMDGKVVGIILLRIMPGMKRDFGSLVGGMSGMGMLPVIVPAEDIAAVAAQAPEEAPKEPTKPAKPDKSGKPAKPAKPTSPPKGAKG